MKFVYKIRSIIIGHLTYDDIWTFQYTEEFKASNFKPLFGFQDLDKIYKSKMLFPHFRARFPGFKQPAIKQIMEQEGILETDHCEILKRFCEKTIVNPFVLEYLGS